MGSGDFPLHWPEQPVPRVIPVEGEDEPLPVSHEQMILQFVTPIEVPPQEKHPLEVPLDVEMDKERRNNRQDRAYQHGVPCKMLESVKLCGHGSSWLSGRKGKGWLGSMPLLAALDWHMRDFIVRR